MCAYLHRTGRGDAPGEIILEDGVKNLVVRYPSARHTRVLVQYITLYIYRMR